MHHRRFHFDIAARVEKLPDFADEQGALQKNFARLSVCDQIHVALAVAQLDIGKAVPLFREAAEAIW